MSDLLEKSEACEMIARKTPQIQDQPHYLRAKIGKKIIKKNGKKNILPAGEHLGCLDGVFRTSSATVLGSKNI